MLVLLLALHLLAALFWVGGMAFAYWVLRPAAGPLDPPLRLPLWRRVFGIFLPWVGVSIAVLLGSGYAMLSLYFGGFAGAADLRQRHAGLGHPDGAAVLAPDIRAMAQVPRRVGSRHTPGRGQKA